MSTWPTPFTVFHPRLPWSLDATAMGLSQATLAALPWQGVVEAMHALEAGAIANPDEQRQVGHYWLRTPQIAPTLALATAIGKAVEQTEQAVTRIQRGELTAPDGLERP